VPDDDDQFHGKLNEKLSNTIANRQVAEEDPRLSTAWMESRAISGNKTKMASGVNWRNSGSLSTARDQERNSS
jgi:hypothetical protein